MKISFPSCWAEPDRETSETTVAGAGRDEKREATAASAKSRQETQKRRARAKTENTERRGRADGAGEGSKKGVAEARWSVRQTDRLTGREYKATRKIKDKERERCWAGGIVVIGRLERGARSLDVDGQRERRQVDAIEDEGREGGFEGDEGDEQGLSSATTREDQGDGQKKVDGREAARKEDQKGPGRNSETRPKREKKKKKESGPEEDERDKKTARERERKKHINAASWSGAS
ncbi:uncharacterized protein ARB_06675 [Trichophyton benhamiae CBS 112371]|uniref:Uncharacterized protein n=1 Tax=Arthroderma benhamiae (strain ATCC MYA-4681 / CBS 112371) TaxID=663331 RepID=D4ARD3_ARTBC|nr:uncharacterized protein ARB_06675 [Trichophyton benhamiae CBS 112371]EFE34276.1 hypothetical protein ARB_06675 [Trichophyton benhamiae CBS 112371]